MGNYERSCLSRVIFGLFIHKKHDFGHLSLIEGKSMLFV